VNLMLAGSFSDEVNAVIFGGRLVALAKKDGGVRLITVGYTLRRLAAKCANNHVIASRSQELQPQQFGAGLSGGAEAAVHATRRLAQNLPSDHVIVKLDTGLELNISKCEIIAENTAAIPDSSILSKFVKVIKDEMTMLGHQSSKDQLRMLL